MCSEQRTCNVSGTVAPKRTNYLARAKDLDEAILMRVDSLFDEATASDWAEHIGQFFKITTTEEWQEYTPERRIDLINRANSIIVRLIGLNETRLQRDVFRQVAEQLQAME